MFSLKASRVKFRLSVFIDCSSKSLPPTLLLLRKSYCQDEKAIANTFSDYFTDVTHSLGLKKKNIGLENTLSKIKKTFRKIESIKKIKKSQQEAENPAFSFRVISEEEVKNAIKDFPINKSTISGDIATKRFKQYAQIYS